MNVFFLIAVFFAIFLNSSFGLYLGVESFVLASMSFFVVYFCLLLYFKQLFLDDTCNTDAKTVIGIGLFVFFVKWLFGQDFFKDCLCFFILPMLLSFVFEQMNLKQRQILRNLLIVFFLVECGLSFYEKITLTHVFNLNISESEWLILNRESWSFRSEALLGHPLLNAHVVAIIMVFIITTNTLPVIMRIFLTFVGFIALLCFNARGATIVSAVVILPYFFKFTKDSSRINRDLVSVLLFIGIPLSIYYVSQSVSLGGRLFGATKLIDGSAQTRLDVFGFYRYLTSYELWIGSPDNYLYLMKILGAGGVENGIIVLIIKYGLVLALFSLLYLVKFHYNKLRICYEKRERWMILVVFYVIGCMNPNLSMAAIWTFWTFSYYAFRPLNKLENIG